MRVLLSGIGHRHQNAATMFCALGRELAERHPVTVRVRSQARSLAGKVWDLATLDHETRAAIAACDVVVVHTPAVMTMRDIWTARALHKRVVVVLWDIFPESANHHARRIPRLLEPLFRLAERWCLRQAHLVLVPSEDFRRHPSLQHLTDVRVLPHGPLALQDWPAVSGPRDDGRLRIAFAGQINDIRDLDGACLALLRAFPHPIELHVFSEDTFTMHARVRAAAAGRLTIVPRGFQPLDVLMAELARLDAGLVSLAPDYTKPASPSKLVTYLQAGLPVVYHGPPGRGLCASVAAYEVGVSLDDVPPSAGPDRLDRIRSAFPRARHLVLDRIRADRASVLDEFARVLDRMAAPS